MLEEGNVIHRLDGGHIDEDIPFRLETFQQPINKVTALPLLALATIATKLFKQSIPDVIEAVHGHTVDHSDIDLVLKHFNLKTGEDGVHESSLAASR